jgi:ankyrin repeat protein
VHRDGRRVCANPPCQILVTSNSGDQKSSNSIHEAAADGDIRLVKSLLSAGADINVMDELKYTPLHRAAMNGHYEIAKLLVAAGADVDAVDSQDQTPLYKAVKAGNKDIAGLLVKNRAYICFPALHFAAFIGDLNSVKKLIEDGTDVDSKDKENQTPLLYAALGGNKQVVEYLVDKGADINAKDKYGRTPLHDAAGNDNDQTVELLIERSAQVDVKDNSGVTPLYLAASGTKEAVELLLAAGADINIKRTTKPDEGFGLLHVASKNSNKRVVEFLITKGLDINAETADGRTALELARDTIRLGSAAKKRRKAIVELLLRHGANR